MEDDMPNQNDALETDREVRELQSLYANNVVFSMTPWDLRILFGHLTADQGGKGDVDWHSDVTIPWAQAKLMKLFLEINLAVYEGEHGKIHVPRTVMPVPLTEPPSGVDKTNPSAIATFERVQELIRAFRDSELDSGSKA